MAVKIRLQRFGKKKQPVYRVVVMDGRKPRDGRYIEAIGRYEPRQDPSLIEIDNDRALDWLMKGAQPTETAQKLLVVSGAAEEHWNARCPTCPHRKHQEIPVELIVAARAAAAAAAAAGAAAAAAVGAPSTTGMCAPAPAVSFRTSAWSRLIWCWPCTASTLGQSG